MKVVYVSLSYFPTVAGGVQVLTHSIAKEMQSRGYEVEVVCAESVEEGDDDQVRSDRTRYDGLPVERFRFNRHHMPEQYFRTFYDVPPVGERLYRIYQKSKPDLFHVTHFSRLSASVFEGMRRLEVPVILTLADYAFLCPLGTLLRYSLDLCPGAEQIGGVKCFGCFIEATRSYKQSLARHLLTPDHVAQMLQKLDHLPGVGRFIPKLYHGAAQVFEDRISYFQRLRSTIDLFTTNNHWSRQFYVDHGFPEERMRTVVQTLDVSWSREFVRRPYDGPLRIGFTGSIVSHKGVDVLIRAFRRMKHREKARLFIFGEKDAHPMYLNELMQLQGGDERIQFRGSYFPADLNRIYNEIDVAVTPSLYYETGPLVILEAQATKTPVVASDLGPIRELVHHSVDGYLFERGNDESLAAILDHLCENRSELERLRSNIRPVKTIGAMADELEVLYREITQRRAA